MSFETFFKKAMVYLLIIVIVVFAFKLMMNIRKVNQMEDRLNSLQQQVQNQIEENKELKEEIERVRSPEYVEKVAREELGLVKPGEILLIPVEEEQDNNQEENTQQQNSEEQDDN
ncbi:MAG TPA: septum formation initiator family protein [Halanaerobiales bacterium]|nr:septum formation initiator family protein [Halanaerobiales bacterium]